MPKVAANVLVIDDDPDILTAARVVLRQKFEMVFTESNHQRIEAVLQKERYDVILLDMNFAAGTSSGHEGLFWLRKILSSNPKQKVILITAYSDVKVAVEAMKIGAADFIVKPWENDKLVSMVQSAIKGNVPAKSLLDDNTEADGPPFIARSPAMKGVLETIKKVAPTDANILLLGESGTGKNLLARHIHDLSSRRYKPFVKVDLGSIVGTLFESELFGHKKGAFTDARDDRTGKFESANGGTLFLDEIANISSNLQAKLLTVLQNREVIPLGSNRQVAIDIRLITATNSDINAEVKAGNFRQDLLYRLNTIEIMLPSLRTRVEDIPVLANYYTEFFSRKYQKEKRTVGKDAMDYLMSYQWPGNVRELQHVVERSVIMSDDLILQKNDFILSGRKSNIGFSELLNLDEMEHKAIESAIHRNHGNLSKVAKELGLGRTTLYRKMIKYGIGK